MTKRSSVADPSLLPSGLPGGRCPVGRPGAGRRPPGRLSPSAHGARSRRVAGGLRCPLARGLRSRVVGREAGAWPVSPDHPRPGHPTASGLATDEALSSIGGVAGCGEFGWTQAIRQDHSGRGLGDAQAPAPRDLLWHFAEEVARATGLEPATSGVTGRHSNQLSYARALDRCTSGVAAVYGAPPPLSSTSLSRGPTLLQTPARGRGRERKPRCSRRA